MNNHTASSFGWKGHATTAENRGFEFTAEKRSFALQALRMRCWDIGATTFCVSVNKATWTHTQPE